VKKESKGLMKKEKEVDQNKIESKGMSGR